MRAVAIISMCAVVFAACASQPQPQPAPSKHYVTCDNLPPRYYCAPNTMRYGVQYDMDDPAQRAIVENYKSPQPTASATPAEWFDPGPPPVDQAAEAARLKANAEYWKREKAERAAVRKAAAAQAERERALDAHQGADCLTTMSRYERDVYDSLRWLQTPEFGEQRCSVQHRVLKYLSAFPPDRRAEEFDRLMDAAGHN